MVPDSLNSLPTPNPTVPGLSELARKVGGTVLASHWQSGIYPFQAAALSRDGVAIVALEPAACPAPTDDLAPYRGLPMLVVWGDNVEQFVRWAPRLENCRNFVAAANRAGARAEMLVLPEVGIKGNFHMLMQDDNSLEIADILLAWIDRNTAKATNRASYPTICYVWRNSPKGWDERIHVPPPSRRRDGRFRLSSSRSSCD